MLSAAAQIESLENQLIEASEADPQIFLEEVLAIPYLTPDQEAVVASVRDHRRTLVTAGNSVGKTFLAARLALWFLFTHPGAKVVTTAPTWPQVANLLWRELRFGYFHSRMPLGGQLNKTDLLIDENWYAVGISTDDATRFQGYHGERVMVIFDEATGVGGHIWEAADGIAVGPRDRMLAIGNPTDPTSRFKAAEDSGLWNVLRLNCENHPNVVTGEEVVPGAVTREWVDERLKDYGDRESPLYRARVRGLWPDQADASLISLKVIEDSQRKWAELRATAGAPSPIVALGCDVARFGSDETIFQAIRLDGTADVPEATRGRDLMDTVGRIIQYGAPIIALDDSGLGGGVTDRLKEIRRSGDGDLRLKKAKIIPVNNAQAAEEDRKFANARAETHWAARDFLKALDLTLPPDHRLAGDLAAPKLLYDSRGRIRIESKDELKKPDRLGRSPDRGDAFVLAAWAYRARRIRQTVHTF